MPEKNLDTALDLKLKGNELFKKTEFEGALDLYNQAIHSCPPHRMSELGIMHQNRAATFERMEKLELAIEDCNASLKCNNRYGKALERRSKVLQKLASKLGGGDENLQKKVDQLTLALEDMSMCCQLSGYRQDLITFTDQLLQELGSAEAILTVKTRTPSLPSGHNIQQYFTSFTKEPFLNDDEGEGPYFQAKKHYKQGEFDKIIPCCDEEIEQKKPSALEAKLTKATFQVLSKQHSEAMIGLSEVISEAGEKTNLKVNALIKRGALHIQRCIDPVKDPALALADFDLALSLDGSSADVYMNRGQVKLLLDKFQEAMEDLNAACRLSPDFALAQVQKLYTDFLAGQGTNDQEKIKTAMSEFEAAIERFPDCVEAYALYAKVLQERNDLDTAEKMYIKGMDLNPKNSNLIVHLALLRLQRNGDVDSAVTAINKAIEMDEKNEYAYETLGQIEIQREKYAEAVEHFNKAIPLVNTELEMAHLFGLRDSARAKMIAKKRLTEIPSGMSDMGLD